MNPTINFAASERTKATVSDAGGGSRSVTFNAGLKVTGTLEDMQLLFTIEAPEDLAVQNELAAMSTEEKNKLAVDHNGLHAFRSARIYKRRKRVSQWPHLRAIIIDDLKICTHTLLYNTTIFKTTSQIAVSSRHCKYIFCGKYGRIKCRSLCHKGSKTHLHVHILIVIAGSTVRADTKADTVFLHHDHICKTGSQFHVT